VLPAPPLPSTSSRVYNFWQDFVLCWTYLGTPAGSISQTWGGEVHHGLNTHAHLMRRYLYAMLISTSPRLSTTSRDIPPSWQQQWQGGG